MTTVPATRYPAAVLATLMLLLSSTIWQPAPVSAAPNLPMSGQVYPKITAEVDAMIVAFVEEHNLPAISFAASKDGRLVASKGYGYADVETGVPLGPDHQIHLGSNTKAAITGPATQLALEQADLIASSTFLYGLDGVFGTVFDDDIANGSAATGTPIEWYYDITVQHLFDHTAGFAGADAEAAEAFFADVDNFSYAHVHAHFLRTKKLKWAPGSNGKYNNHHFGVQELVIRALTGKDAYDFVHTELLAPYGLHPEIELKTEPNGPLTATSHTFEDGDPVAIEVDYSESVGLLAGGYRSSTRDTVELLTRLAEKYTPYELDRIGFSDGGVVPGHDWGDSSAAYVSHFGRHEGGTSYMTMTVDGYNASIQTNIWASTSVRNKMATLTKDIIRLMRADGMWLYYDLWEDCGSLGTEGGLLPPGASPDTTCDPIGLAPNPNGEIVDRPKLPDPHRSFLGEPRN